MKQTINLYEIILELKRFLQKAEDLATLKDLDILISEVKNYVIATEILGTYYNRLKSNDTKKKLVYKTIERIVRRIIREIINPLIEKDRNMRNKVNSTMISCCFYFNPLSLIMPDNIQAYMSIADFYIKNVHNHIDRNRDYDFAFRQEALRISSKISYYVTKKLRNSIDFCALSFEDYIVYGRTGIADDFYFCFMKSALIGVLHQLQYYIKSLLFKEKDSIMTDINNLLENNSSLPHLFLQGKSERIFDELCIDTSLSAKELANLMGVSTSTMQKQIKELAKKLSYGEEMELKCGGGKKFILDYIKIHKLQRKP